MRQKFQYKINKSHLKHQFKGQLRLKILTIQFLFVASLGYMKRMGALLTGVALSVLKIKLENFDFT